MNNLTSLFSSIIASILVTLFEGIFLFVILIPVINKLSHRIGFKINEILYFKQHNNSFYTHNSTIIHLHPKYYLRDDSGYYLRDELGNIIINPKYKDNEQLYQDEMDLYYYKLYRSYKNIFTPTEKTILKYGAVDEELFLKTQKNIPYIMYALIMLVLVIGLVIIVIISKKYKIDIDYKISLIVSVISFILICGFASTILWFSVFAQSYKLDINKSLFKSLLDTYVNL